MMAMMRQWPAPIALLLLSLALSLRAQQPPKESARVLTGADVLLRDSLEILRGLRVGLIVNHTSLLSTGAHLADTLHAAGIRVTALFAPEHGIRGALPAGFPDEGGIDSATGLPINSLYGKIRRPSAEMLKGVDILVYDLQDVGVRFFTYVSTLYVCMEAAAESGIPFVVLDRPDPIGGVEIEGPILDTSLRSFVGMTPIPIRYGMTPGELARMIDGEGWLAAKRRCPLRVVPLRNWRREAWYDDAGLRWVAPSPNMKTLDAAAVYPGACLFEGTNLSEGRGTEHPFEWIGAPFLDGRKLAAELEARYLPGARFSPVSFTPRAIRGVAPSPKHEGERCYGVSIHVTDRARFRPVAAALHLLDAAMRQAPGKIRFTRQFDILSGQHDLRTGLEEGVSPDSLLAGWKRRLAAFAEARKRYLAYP